MRERARAALVAASMTAIAVLTVPTLAWAAHSPEGAVHDLLDAIELERLDDLDGLVCEEQQAAIRDRFDFAAGMPAGLDPGIAIDAVDLRITKRSVELIEQTDASAEVRVGGQFGARLDDALIRELAESSLGSLGVEVGPEQIDDLVAQLDAQLAAGSPIADDVTVTHDGSSWLVCDDISVGQDAALQSSEGLCAYMTVAELNAIDEECGGAGSDSYARSFWDEETQFCTYEEGEGGIGSVKLKRYETPFDEALEVLGSGTDEMVAGRRARLVPYNDLFVELEDGTLYVNAPGKYMPDEEDVSYLAMPAAVAELVLSRIED